MRPHLRRRRGTGDAELSVTFYRCRRHDRSRGLKITPRFGCFHYLCGPEQLRGTVEPMETVYIRDAMIRLGQFLKLANLVEDGAQAREVIQRGLVEVNGQVERARGKQLHPGDTVTFNGVSVRVGCEG